VLGCWVLRAACSVLAAPSTRHQASISTSLRRRGTWVAWRHVGGTLCPRKPRSSARVARSAPAKRRRRRRASSFARRCITFARESTAHDQRNRRLRSAFQRRAAPASSCRGRGVRNPRRGVVQSTQAALPRAVGRGRRRKGLVRCAPRSRGKAGAPRHARHCRGRQEPPRGGDPQQPAADRHSARCGQRDRGYERQRRVRRRGRDSGGDGPRLARKSPGRFRRDRSTNRQPSRGESPARLGAQRTPREAAATRRVPAGPYR
jgi:hypothetical protein